MEQMAEKSPRRGPIEERSAPGAHRRNRAVARSAAEIQRRKDAVTRRELFKFGAGAAIAGGITLGAFKLYELLKGIGANEEEASSLASSIHERDSDGRIAARLEEMHDSPLFLEQLRAHMRHYRDGGDLALALRAENGRAATLNDPQHRSRIDYVREEVMAGITDEEIPADIRRELSFFATGMLGTETKYQNDLPINSVDARGVVQAIPDTYEGYGKDEDQMRYFTHQVDVMRGMFKDYYAMMTDQSEEAEVSAYAALRKIKANYFRNKSESEFNTQFVSLCLVNAYQVGIGNMCTVIQKFADLPVVRSLRSYDVFEAMASVARDGSLDRDYQEESYNYAKQSSAFAFLLAASDTSAV
jgi:hypothetical protein